MTEKEREAFRRYIASAPSNAELLRQAREEFLKDPANVQQPGEHPIDWRIRRFFAHESESLRRSHVGVIVKCPSCGNEVLDSDGKCKKCNAIIHPQPTKAWWEGDVKLGITVCSCCDERIATKMCQVRLVKVTSCLGGTLSYYEKYIHIPTCGKCYLKAKIPFVGKRTLDKNILLHYLFDHEGCGLDEYTSPLPFG